MFRTFLISFVFGLCSLPASAGVWTLDQEKSGIEFSVIQIGGIVVEGVIPQFSAEICFDEKDVESTRAVLTFNISGATTGIKDRDAILRAPEWLSAEVFPEGHFVLESLTNNEATGTLILKGIKKEITFSLTLNLLEKRAEGDLTIDRRDFNIGEGRWGETEKWVRFEIRISFYLVADPNGGSCD